MLAALFAAGVSDARLAADGPQAAGRHRGTAPDRRQDPGCRLRHCLAEINPAAADCNHAFTALLEQAPAPSTPPPPKLKKAKTTKPARKAQGRAGVVKRQPSAAEIKASEAAWAAHAKANRGTVARGSGPGAYTGSLRNAGLGTALALTHGQALQFHYNAMDSDLVYTLLCCMANGDGRDWRPEEGVLSCLSLAS